MRGNVLDYLEQSRAAYPQKCAVIDEREQLTYDQLYRKSRRIGTALCKWVSQGQPVGVYLDKCADALCVFLGTVYAGGFYSVLNPELPKARLAQIAGVLSPRVIVTRQENAAAAAEIFPDFSIVTVEQLMQSEPDEARLTNVRRRAVDTDPLYVNFTSGSTGTPKGIVVAHRSVLDFIGCFTELFGITGEDVIANQAPFDFDVSVKDIYSALSTGATLLIVPRHLFSAPAALIDFLCEHRATTMIWAVSALCLITTFHALDYRVPETVNKVLFSGEVMPAKALADLRRHLPDAMYV
ncbi:MAG: AMP-binding protein, partial [Clostridiales bacterium]|nr:AMP-binding protein [Clostridiales bacterium]